MSSIFPSESESPKLGVQWTTDTPHKARAKVPVALVDFDANVDFLPDLAAAANGAQVYYDFEVLYLPFPSGVVRPARYDVTGTEVPRFYMPELEGYLDKAPESLKVKVICCLTSGLIADGEKYDDLFSLPLATNPNVFAISTYGLRDYAKEAKTSFAKATLFLCISELLMLDPRWSLQCHPETVGCPLDFCDERDDIVEGLKKMEFSHQECRQKIKDEDMLKAIDAFLALKVEA
jgi:hypothetical protein